ncbi:MAG TPA: hypothetical protein GXX59_07045 [Syntrophomonadaceae bacterium]|nr:hypothetical protein [Syntrophomonadaceae bacterium]
MAGVTEVNAVNASAQQTLNVGMQNLGKDDFLKLLICQLKQQDPLEPVKNTEFIAQMSQLTSLENLQELNIKLEYLMGMQQLAREREDLAFAASLLGRHIEAVSPENGQVMKGSVRGFHQERGGIWLELEEKAVPLHWVNKVLVTAEDGEDL